MEKYRVNGFPTILYIRAGSKGLDVSEFEEDPRSYENFNKWVNKAVKVGNKKIQKLKAKKEEKAKAKEMKP